ncbi:MAG TPA: ATP-binding protein [Vicinamibacterales bacterium]|nr:ATP-binding protein [Vicinamibacterales bacterium]
MCPLCNDTHWKSIDVDGVERVVRCDCWRGDVVARLLSDARIPPRFTRADLSNFEHDMNTQRHAWQKANAFVEAFPVVERGLVLFGPHGVGKTHLAIGILKACVRTKGARGYFFETRELLRLVRDTYNRSVEETEMEILKPLLEADLLVLDDLGAERTSEWVQETLGLVVNTRYNARRPTIFTSNLVDLPDNTDPRSFIFQLGARTRSRLIEMCDWVEIQGADIREVGPHASPDDIAKWKSTSPASPENVDKAAKLPPRARTQARAQLRPARGDGELKWTGGKAGS